MSGLGSFIQGAFEGFSYGENLKDKRAERGYRKDRHEWEGDRQERLAEQHEWRRDDHGWNQEVRQQQRGVWDREEDARQAHADAYAATKDSFTGERSVIEPAAAPGDDPILSPGTVSTQGDEAAPGDPRRTRNPHPDVYERGPSVADAPGQLRAPELPTPNPHQNAAGRPSMSSDGPNMTRTPPMQPPMPGGEQMPERGVMDEARGPNVTGTRTEMVNRHGAPDNVTQMAREADGLEAMLNAGVYSGSNEPMSESDQAMYADLLAQRDAELGQWAQANVDPSEMTDAFSGAARGQARAGTQAVQGNPNARLAQPPRADDPPVQLASLSPAPDRGAPLRPQPQQAWRASPDPQPPRNPPRPSRPSTNQRDPRMGGTPEPQPVTERAAQAGRGVYPPGRTEMSEEWRAQPGDKGGAATGATPVEQASTEELDARATATVDPEQGGSAAVQSASETLTRGVVGEDGAVRSTPERDERAVDSFMDRYMKVGAPMVIEHYLETGQIDKAQAFEEWVQGREVQQSMRSWAQAVRSAAVGDEESFLDHLADTYNGVDDGYKVDRSRSGFMRDGQGNIVGGQVTYIDGDGNEFTREYDDQQDLIELGIYSLAPEQMFEYLMGLTEQANQTRVENTKAVTERRDEYAGRVEDQIKTLIEAYKGLDGTMTKSMEEIRLEAEQMVRQADEAGRRLSVSAGAAPPPDFRLSQ